MSRSPKRGWFELMLAPLTLIPVTGIWSVAAIVWTLMAKEKGHPWAGFLGVAGFLVGVGMILTFKILEMEIQDPAMAKLRQDLHSSLETLGRTDARSVTVEAELTSTAAQTERG